MTAIYLRTDSTAEVVEIGGLKDMQKAVGGYFETARLDDPFRLIVNEEGAINGLKVNVKATRLYGWSPIFGDVLIMKSGENEDGEPDIIGLDEKDIAYFRSEFTGVKWREK